MNDDDDDDHVMKFAIFSIHVEAGCVCIICTVCGLLLVAH